MQIDVVNALIPIKPLGLIVHGLCFLGVNIFAIECISNKSCEMHKTLGYFPDEIAGEDYKFSVY